LLGDDISQEQLLRIVHKEVIEKPAEQEVLFVRRPQRRGQQVKKMRSIEAAPLAKAFCAMARF